MANSLPTTTWTANTIPTWWLVSWDLRWPIGGKLVTTITSPSCWVTHFLYLSNPPSGNLLPIIPWSARPWSQQKQTSIPSQCVSILFRRNFYISSGCIESLTCFKKCFSALYLSFVSVSSVGVRVLLMLNIFLIFPVDARMFLMQHRPGTSRCFLQTTKC